jgi:protoporphyrinogen oxidase/GT2 family glycosyltransferase
LKAVVIGAGISGLTTAMLLRRKGVAVEVLEAAPYCGGFAHSFTWNRHRCDWAAHRLFTHDEHVLQQLQALVPMRRLERVSAVHLGGKWLKDPVDALQLCLRFFPRRTFAIPLAYLARPRHLAEISFQHYCYARFGRVLGDFLFAPYTVKMFGIPAHEISVEWARKKVRLAGPLDVIRQGSKKKFSYFHYPARDAFGALAETLYAEVRDCVRLNTEAVGLTTAGGRITGVRCRRDGTADATFAGDAVISTIPLTALCAMLGHTAPLTYRAVAAVYVLVNKPQTTPNHWIYYMDGNVAVNRLCEFKNLNPALGPPETSVVCAEVTDRSRPDFVDRTVRDLAASGIFALDQVKDTTVVTRDYAYPVYRRDYEQDVDRAEEHLARFKNLYYLGRAAQFEHMEVDDCFAAAVQLVRELTAPPPQAAVETAPARAALPVQPQVAGVIVATGSSVETLECLEALSASDYRQLSLVLVANAGDTALRAGVTPRFPRLHWCETPAGMGLAAAFNAGCKAAVAAGADFIFCTLSQTTVEKDTLSHLVRVAQRDPEAGLLTPKILAYEQRDRIWSIGNEFRSFPPSTRNIGAGRKDDRRFAASREVEFAVSCGLLVKREVLTRIGLFDPGYDCYYEDLDFSQRARADGFRIRFVPEARMYYREGERRQRTDDFYRSWGASFARYYRRRMRPLWLKLPWHLSYLLLREALTGNARHAPALGRGIFQGLQQRLGRIPRLEDEFLERR